MSTPGDVRDRVAGRRQWLAILLGVTLVVLLFFVFMFSGAIGKLFSLKSDRLDRALHRENVVWVCEEENVFFFSDRAAWKEQQAAYPYPSYLRGAILYEDSTTDVFLHYRHTHLVLEFSDAEGVTKQVSGSGRAKRGRIIFTLNLDNTVFPGKIKMVFRACDLANAPWFDDWLENRTFPFES